MCFVCIYDLNALNCLQQCWFARSAPFAVDFLRVLEALMAWELDVDWKQWIPAEEANDSQVFVQ